MTAANMTMALEAALEAQVAAGAPGALVAIEAPAVGVEVAVARGRFALAEARPLEAFDPFRAASVTKAVTAASAVALAAAGRWRLDDPIGPYLPERLAARLARLPGLESADELTVRRLLAHTSGLRDYFFDERFQARVQAEPERTWRPIELAEAALEAGPVAFAPGTDFAYGDTGYVLVGLALERLLDRPLAEVYRTLVLAPLGMESTYLEWHEPARGGELSHHYDGERDLTGTNTSFDWAGGGLVTTAGDLVRFLGGLFGGALFGARWRAEMTRWRDQLRWRPGSSAHYLRYGLGIGVNRAAGETLVGATGVWGAFAYYWPRGGAAVAGTVNRVGADRAALLEAIIEALKATEARGRVERRQARRPAAGAG